MLIDQARFLVLNAANAIDKKGPKNAKKEIGMAKVRKTNNYYDS